MRLGIELPGVLKNLNLKTLESRAAEREVRDKLPQGLKVKEDS